MPKLLTQNSKLKKTSKLSGIRTFNFGIPAFKTESGKVTCPFAESCVVFCYANEKGAYSWPSVKNAYNWRYQQTKKSKQEFVDMISKEIDSKRNIGAIRIHDSGDFYSIRYRNNWYQIMHNYPELIFYAYTNSMPFFRPIKKVYNDKGEKVYKIVGKDFEKPDNFTIIHSSGGKYKHLRKESDFVSDIFKTKEDLINAGYMDCSDNDLLAIDPTNKKKGLILH